MELGWSSLCTIIAELMWVDELFVWSRHNIVVGGTGQVRAVTFIFLPLKWTLLKQCILF